MTTTWTIAQLDRELADGYVYTVHYKVDATDGTYSSGAYGSIGLEKPDTLVPYKDLTEEVVVGWVKTKLNSEAVEAAKIAEQKTPTVGTGIPWS